MRGEANIVRVTCIGCNRREFEVLVVDVENAKIITFMCPECGEYTAVSERPGGGVMIGRDAYALEVRDDAKKTADPG